MSHDRPNPRSVPHPAEAVPASPATPDPGEVSGTVYACLRSIAQRKMQEERRGHTLTATALVHEAYLRLAPEGLAGSDRAHFFHAAAEAMRHVLIDHARRRAAAKRGGDARRVTEIESVADLARDERPEDVLALDEAISLLETADPEAGAVVRLRFFAGLTGEQTAEVIGLSPRQVDREWAWARVFLLRALGAQPSGR